MAGAEPVGRLPASQRVKKRTEFARIQEQSRRVVTPHFVLLLAPHRGTGEGPRLGITASRRVGGAVVRNRAKRLVREAFRATRELWPTDLDLVVIVRGIDPHMKLSDVTKEWRAATRHIQRQLSALTRTLQTQSGLK